MFQIDESTGVITFISSPDYENPSDNNTDNNYSIIITAANDKGSAQLSLIVTVIDNLNDNSQISLPGAGEASSLLLNISTAGYVSTDAKMSGGFIIVGNPMDVLVTAKSSKENDVDPLINPRLEVVPLARDKNSRTE